MARHNLASERRAKAARRAQRGVSLVEFLVGSALGLMILTASATLLASHIQCSKQLLQQARLRHDLRASVHLISRHLRRAAHWGSPQPMGPAAFSNPYGEVQVSSQQVIFYTSRDAIENHRVDRNEVFGVRLRAGVMEMALGDHNWQALTDPEVLKIVDFSIQPDAGYAIPSPPCGALCSPSPEAGSDCSTQQQSRSLHLRVAGQSAQGSSEQHVIETLVHLRNDRVLNCPAQL